MKKNKDDLSGNGGFLQSYSNNLSDFFKLLGAILFFVWPIPIFAIIVGKYDYFVVAAIGLVVIVSWLNFAFTLLDRKKVFGK